MTNSGHVLPVTQSLPKVGFRSAKARPFAQRKATLTLLCLIGAFALGPPARGQDACQPIAEHAFLGHQRCVECHYNPTPFRPRDLVLLTESQTWFTQDRHAQAFNALLAVGGQAILDRLGVDDPATAVNDRDPPAVVRQCLACHANWRRDVATPARFHQIKTSGVGCESCHGPSSSWIYTHAELDPAERKDRQQALSPAEQALWEQLGEGAVWRTLAPCDKKKFGMVDVRNPKERAAQCFSCHLGNIKQGKFVTHAMYAAGHPPLPGFEMESFAQEMPPHWRNLPEKGDFKYREEFVAANYAEPEGAAAELPQTKAVIVGGVMALRETAQLLADYAEAATNPETGAASSPVVRFPDFAVYDCASCHHALRPEGWRPGRVGLPIGRPPMPEWPTALLAVGIDQWTGGDAVRSQEAKAAFDKSIHELREAVVRRPFGDPAAIADKAASLRDSLDKLADSLAQGSFSRDDALRARRLLLELGRGSGDAATDDGGIDLDFHSARQIAWAYRTISIELRAGYPTGLATRPSDAESDNAARLRAQGDIDRWESWRRGARKVAEDAALSRLDALELNQKLCLNLPASAARRTASLRPDPAAVSDELWQSTHGKFQTAYLQAMASFDPEWFAKTWKDLAAAEGAAAGGP